MTTAPNRYTLSRDPHGREIIQTLPTLDEVWEQSGRDPNLSMFYITDQRTGGKAHINLVHGIFSDESDDIDGDGLFLALHIRHRWWNERDQGATQ